MGLMELILILCAVGIILYCIDRFLPLDGKMRYIIHGVIILAVILFLLRAFGVWDYLNKVRIG